MGKHDMIENFNFHLATRIVWQTPAAAAVASEVGGLGASSALIVTDPGLLATGIPGEVASALEEANVTVAVHAEVGGNPTTDDVAAARSLAEQSNSEVVIAVGGGSAIDTAKAAAMLIANGGEYRDYQWEGRAITRRSHPFVAVPTTAGTGSEVSKVAVISDPSEPFKKGVLSPLMFAHVAILDPELTIGLPSPITAATGIDAFIHALEAYTGKRPSPFSDLLALESLRLAFTSLARATTEGTNLDARRDMMLAAAYGGIAMDHAGLGLVHALSGGICSHLHLHHGLANAMALPFVARFNADSIPPDRVRRLAQIFGLPDTASGHDLAEVMSNFVEELDLPIGLTGLDQDLDDVNWDSVAEESMKMVMVHNNPRKVTLDDCHALLSAMR